LLSYYSFNTETVYNYKLKYLLNVVNFIKLEVLKMIVQQGMGSLFYNPNVELGNKNVKGIC